MKKLRKKKTLHSLKFRKNMTENLRWHPQFNMVKKSINSLEDCLQNKAELNTIQYLFNKTSYAVIKLPKPFILPTDRDTKMGFFVCFYNDLLEKWDKISERCFARGIKRLSEPELNTFIKEHKITFDKYYNTEKSYKKELHDILWYNINVYKEENEKVQDKDHEKTKKNTNKYVKPQNYCVNQTFKLKC